MLLFKAAVDNFGININTFFVFYLEKWNNTHKQQLISDVV